MQLDRRNAKLCTQGGVTPCTCTNLSRDKALPFLVQWSDSIETCVGRDTELVSTSHFKVEASLLGIVSE